MLQNHSGHRYQKIKKIGQGTYGTVTKVYDNKLKIFNVVKKIKFYDQQETIPVHALREITSLKQLVHPNIMKLFDITYQPSKRKLYMILEYIQETLHDYIQKNLQISKYETKFIVYQILQGLRYLQLKSYMHRDLKPQNIMLTKDNKIKLIDFGQIKKFNLTNQHPDQQTLQVSTLWYKAPQVLLGYRYYSNKVDIWAVGCILAELITGTPLFQGKSEIDQIFKIFQAFGTPRISDNLNMKEWEFLGPCLPKFEEKVIQILALGQDGNDLLRKMLQINPQKRICINDALKHKFFDGLS